MSVSIKSWKYLTGTATGSFVKVPIELKAKHLKMKTATTLEFSFDGSSTAGKLVAADGMQTFQDVGKSDIWVKGAGVYDIIAWDGN